MTPRLEATHFIEQTVGVYTGKTYNSQPYHLEFINALLKVTSQELTPTVAIFKIKFKNNQHEIIKPME